MNKTLLNMVTLDGYNIRVREFELKIIIELQSPALGNKKWHTHNEFPNNLKGYQNALLDVAKGIKAMSKALPGLIKKY